MEIKVAAREAAWTAAGTEVGAGSAAARTEVGTGSAKAIAPAKNRSVPKGGIEDGTQRR